MECAGAVKLSKGLTGSALTELDLAHNFIGSAGLSAISELLAARPTDFLKTLSLAGNSLSGRKGKVQAQQMLPEEE
eukprot:3499607-Pyramimonas_sp.AAC.1